MGTSTLPIANPTTNPSTALLPKPHRPPATTLLLLLTCLSLVSAATFAFLLFSPSTSTTRSSTSTTRSSTTTTTARPLTKLRRPHVILLSFDGFRFGYQFKTPTPNIHRLISEGSEAELGLYPVFPSLTFPNHYSIATGLYPPYHGIVNNNFVDPALNDSFTTRRHDPKFWLGQPIWETAADQGHPAAAIFWAGSEVVKGSWTCPPKFCPAFNSSVPFEDRVDAVLGYFDLPPAEIPVISAVYFNDPDSQGHVWGPDHPEITKAVAHVDAVVGRLIAGLEARGIFDDVTVVMLGDHGMVSVCDKKYMYLEDLAPWVHIPRSWVQSFWQLIFIQPPPGVAPAEVVAKANQGLSSGKVSNGDKVRLYLKEDLPERFHYSDSVRIPSIVGVVDEGYSAAVDRSDGSDCVGAHGYDNLLFSMRSIFIGRGPQFARGRKIPSFVNVEVYNILTSILKLKPAPNNGTAGFANQVLLPTH